VTSRGYTNVFTPHFGVCFTQFPCVSFAIIIIMNSAAENNKTKHAQWVYADNMAVIIPIRL